MTDATSRAAAAKAPRSPAPALRGELMWAPIAAASAHAFFLVAGWAPLAARWSAHGTKDTVALSLEWTLVSIAGYLLAVGATLLWAPVTKPKEAEGMREAMFVYNVYMTLLSAFMFVGIAYEYTRTDSWRWDKDRVKGPNGVFLAYLLFVNYVSKPTEYLDTYFMAIKGNLRQITFLHVVHHALMPLIMYILITMYPGGNSCFGPMLNSFVHTIMYGYYCLTGLGVTVNAKPIITTVQMIQFVVLMGQAVVAWRNDYRYWPMIVTWISAGLMVLMIVLFGDFAIKAYCRKGKKDDKSE